MPQKLRLFLLVLFRLRGCTTTTTVQRLIVPRTVRTTVVTTCARIRKSGGASSGRSATWGTKPVYNSFANLRDRVRALHFTRWKKHLTLFAYESRRGDMTWFGGKKPPYEYVAQGVFGLVINCDERPEHPIIRLTTKPKGRKHESNENIYDCDLAGRHCCRV